MQYWQVPFHLCLERTPAPFVACSIRRLLHSSPAPFVAQLAAAAAFLAFAPAVHAQSLTLNSGDAVTVDGTGTHGTINNSTTSYTGSDYAVQANDGSAFTLGSGGSLSSSRYDGLDALGSSTITVTGGTVTGGSASGGDGMYATGSGPISISGGTFVGNINANGIQVTGSSTVSITDGSFSGGNGVGFQYSGSGSAVISGGTFSGRYGGFNSSGTGSVLITGGTFNGDSGISTSSADSTITVTGGQFNASFVGNGYGGFSESGGTINLFSLGDTPFLINGVPMNNTAIPANTSGTISGTLLDGEVLNTTFSNYDFSRLGTINLNVGVAPAPEPSQFAAFAVGLLGLGGLRLRARRRQA